MAARRKDFLEDLANEFSEKGLKADFLQTDVTNEQQCLKLMEYTVAKYGGIDILVNNAGISMRAIFESVELDTFRKVMDVNFYGAIYCTKYALPHLLKNKGSVVGVSSIAGFLGLPARTAYSASKSAIHGFLNALRSENRKTGLHVLLACPGYTESNIRKTALDASGRSQGESPLNESKIMSAEVVAEAIAKAIELRKNNLVLTMEGRMAVFLSKFFPGFINRMVFKKVSAEKGSPIRMK